MKIPIRNPKKLQATIDRHVAAVEYASRLFKHDREQYKNYDMRLRDIYAAVREAGRPVDYRYVTYALGLAPTLGHHWRTANRMGNLAQRGYLRQVGYGPIRYLRKPGASLFVAVPPEEIAPVQRRIQSAVNRLVAAVERAEQYVNDVPICVARRMGDHPYTGVTAMHDRNMEIIRLRLSGLPLKTIGDKYGMTRERVRQIVERAVKRTPVNKLTLNLMAKGPTKVRARRYSHKKEVLIEAADAILRMPKKYNW